MIFTNIDQSIEQHQDHINSDEMKKQLCHGNSVSKLLKNQSAIAVKKVIRTLVADTSIEDRTFSPIVEYLADKTRDQKSASVRNQSRRS